MKSIRPLLVVAVAGLVLFSAWETAAGRTSHGGVVVVAPHGSTVVVRPHHGFQHPVVDRPHHGFTHPVPRVFVHPRGFPVAINPWKFWSVAVFPRAFVAPPFFPLVASVPVTGIYPSPSPAYPSTVVADAQTQTETGTVSVPAPTPIPTVIEYPTGWHQLRGDGISAPYVWVWVPKPPAPPAARPPAVPPASPQQPPAPSERRSPTSHGELYRWVDDQQVVHLTDQLDRVPTRYRSRVERVSYD